MPDDAAAYFAVDVCPEGASRARLEAAVRKLTGGGDPAVALRRVLDDRLETVHKSYESDVAPWLGRRVGIWADDLGPGATGAIVAAVRNEDRARKAVKEGARSEQNLAGTTLYRRSSGQSGIVLYGLAIYGDERAVRASVAALRSGSLRDAPAYRNAAAALDRQAVAVGYLDSAAFARSVAGLAPGSAGLVDVGLEVLGIGPGDPLAFAVSADPGQLALEVGLPPEGAPGGLELADLPDAPIAVTLNGLGPAVRHALEGSALGSGSSAFDFDTLVNALGRTLRLDVRRDLIRWAENAALTYAGQTPQDFAAELVLTTSDRRAADRTMRRLARRVLSGRGGPAPAPARGRLAHTGTGAELGFGRAGRRVLAALGRRAFTRLLRPTRRVGDTDRYRDARRALGGTSHRAPRSGPHR